MPKIRIKKLPKAAFGLPVQGTQAVQNIVNQDVQRQDQIAGRLADQPYYNPFDVKWGQQQQPQVDITGSSSNTQYDPYATSTSNSMTASQGSLNLPQLVDTKLLSADPKQNMPKSKTTGFGQKLKNLSNAFNKITDNQWVQAGLMGANYLENRQKTKEFERWQRQSLLPENYMAVDTTHNRGDYDVNSGIFKPDAMGFKSKGTQANAYYPQQNFVEYGGEMPYAAEGMLVTGDANVQKAFLPISPSINIPSFETSIEPTVKTVPTSASSKKTSDISLKGTDIATKTNNPGNMKFHPWMKRFGAESSGIPGKDGGVFASFPDLESGLKAYQTQLFGNTDGVFKSSYYKADTPVDKALRIWSNDGYGANIYPQIAGKTLGELTQQERDELAKRQIKMESGSMYKQLKEAGIFKNGGQNNNSMKIRIVDTPDENLEMAYGGQPPYSGQTDYGLYVGQRNLYRAMPKNMYDSTKNTVSEEKETPNNPHILEAEGGETILRPDGTHMNIEGRKHSEGGEKLTKEQAPEGSFIFSNAGKLKLTAEEAKQFSKTGNKKHTPAAVAKQYDKNKYLGILQDKNSDPLAKATARKMLENYDMKLAQLALVQEGKKGFPQGVPDIAKPYIEKQTEQPGEEQAMYGGMYNHGGMHGKPGTYADGYSGTYSNGVYFNSGGYIPEYGNNAYLPKALEGLEATDDDGKPRKVKKSEIADLEKQGWKKDPNTNVWRTERKETVAPTIIKGTPGKEAVIQKGKGPEKDTYKGPKMSNAAWLKFLQTPQGLKYKEKYITGTPDVVVTPEVKATPDVKQCPPDHTLNPTTGECERIIPDAVTYDEEPKTDTIPSKTIPGITPTTTPASDKVSNPYGWTSQNLRNVRNATMDYLTLKKYFPHSTPVQPVLPEFTPQDWRAPAAQAFSTQYAAPMATMSQYSGRQGIGSIASSMAGKAAETITGSIIPQVAAYNAQGQTATDAQRAQILNQTNQYNAALRDKDWEQANVYDDRYRAAERLARKGRAKAINEGEDVASKIYNQNLTEKYFKINPYTQQMMFNSPAAKAAWEAQTRGGYQEQTTDPQAFYKTMKDMYDQLDYISDPKDRQAAAEKYAHAIHFGNKTSSVNYPMNSAKSKITTTGYNYND